MTDMADVSVDLGALAREAALPDLKFSRSPDIDKLAGALAKAQGAMSNATKDSANPYFGSKYADLAAVVDVIRKPLADNGLGYLQPFTCGTKSVTVSTILLHESGQWISTEATYPVLPQARKGEAAPNPNAPVTPQAFGSATTYLRRYALSSMLGIAQEDDDGNRASGNDHQRPPPANDTDAVKGALSRQASASAKKAEPTKEATKPDAIPAPQTPEAMEAAMRFSSLWEKAKKAGYKSTEFQEFSARILGAKKPSSALTPDEVGALESAWAAETAQ